MATPVDIDRLWTSLRVAEEATHHGTALIKKLSELLVRKDAMSAAWLDDRRKLRAKIEAHLAAVKDVEREVSANPLAMADDAGPIAMDTAQALSEAAPENLAVASKSTLVVDFGFMAQRQIYG